MILNFIHWSVEPEIFPNTSIPIRWYGLFFVLAFYISYILLNRIFKKEGKDIQLLDKLTMYMLVATIVGARLGHCLFYGPHFDTFGLNGEIIERGFLSHPIDILKIWEGGLASHGAAIAIIIAIVLFARKHKETSFFWIMDRVVIMVAMAGFWIRMGNLVNSEIIGKPTSLAWGFIFEKLEPYGVFGPHHPAQLYEALSYLALFFFLLWFYYKKDGKARSGQIFGIFLIVLFVARFLIEYVKEDQVGFESDMVLNMGQWLSIPFILIGIAILIFVKDKQEELTPIVDDKPEEISS
ncbi:MAG: prolipoprotein diacylglyceryl transferase [Bacteroidetes bacterium]|jgi:phosphatidylglycerol---prolipoprotein diacylglyceryl transferase|nr:prolipoprotein diacylglyceryl transferase [Bacteroidota bacterium]MBT5528458.1 prolipoprotein diacylglyceryl transferase [Cytophagia bacterium]MBT3933756.1 prolipoprotein diacylglyceryl transferase [Bacteroidota bacterium]MBT4338101.1 prolipoprotein diacylglyceryl transferase [Bacteroidota bacterium]MBT4727377.1 prolipoprotein diacylglyceryl transferase [Bacteroidota bacterium]